ncbi:response regulator transcription factor [Telmatospirillum sp. J64-1]|uniref:response regulator transcription factor n=1 Tax=Telmatospirillum sp. J64-1 TaxID=2502183 RepID=UPI001C8F6B28|nr:response regulator transcription factor [Telmatospirillum sp. J64-1]
MKSRDIVLVVDDFPGSLSMLTDAIEAAGLTVLVALEGPKALSLVEKITPDIILMDAVMPEMDGFETCRRLKAMPALADVPVIFMTGLSETEHVVRGFEAGGVDYVTKPIVPEQLIARIKVHLANARLTQSARAALDATGKYLLAVGRDGTLRWATPQASERLADLLAPVPAAHDDRMDVTVLPQPVVSWLGQVTNAGAKGGEVTGPVLGKAENGPLRLCYVGQVGPDEFLLRLVEDKRPREEDLLKQHLALTTREAEVLLWVARGKASRDIATILGLSPRTVDKHLEQVYGKLGVENRAGAAVAAMKVLTRE